MDRHAARVIVSVIRAEEERRLNRLRRVDADVANDQWLFTDEPFVNELCLIVLVAVSHHVERELLWLSARITEADEPSLHWRVVHENVRRERNEMRGARKGWDRLKARLKLESSPDWEAIETLRLVANGYKHDTRPKPGKRLLDRLQLRTDRNYGSFSESQACRAALAVHLRLSDSDDYCAITLALIDEAERFLRYVETNVTVAKITGGVSIHSDDAEH